MSRTLTKILAFAPEHLALLETQVEQHGEAERFGQTVGRAAALGPAFSAVEMTDDGQILRVLACAGLAESRPVDDGGGYATAWGSFGKDLRPAQWSAITAAIRAVLDNCGYARVDMLVSAGFGRAERYAEALGFTVETIIYARANPKTERTV